LRISRETEKRIASEIEQLNKTGKTSPEIIKDYEIYHERVQAMVDENRKIVERMEAAYARHSSAKTSSNVAPLSDGDKIFDPNIPEEQTVDEVAELDRQLNESLAQFDDRLLKEMNAIRAESAKKMQDLAQEAAEAAKRLREKGMESDTSGAESSEDESESGREMESAEGGADTATASRDKSRKGGKGPSRKEPRRADYENDDIVARQLREAAENETDPELKEKLWKEYEEYKKSR